MNVHVRIWFGGHVVYLEEKTRRMAVDVVCARHNVYRGSHVLSAAAVLDPF